MAITIGQLFDSVIERFRADKADGISLVFHFDISGAEAAQYTIDVRDNTCMVRQGLHDASDCTITADSDTYLGLETGAVNPQEALMQGRVQVSNLMNMLVFAKLFKKYDAGIATESISRGFRQLPKGPLNGLRIIDFTRLLPGPLATMFLAEMGAEVIKVEDKHSPDYIRGFPPFINGVSAYYLALNRGKYSVSIDFRAEQSKLVELVKTADVLIEQYRPGVMNDMGLGYEAMKALNPKLIYISVTGYGQIGINAQMAGHDINYLAASGLLGLNKDENGKPVLPGFQLADVGGGSYMAITACTAALYEREKTGVGRHIDVSMTNAVVPLLALPLASQTSQGHTIKELAGGIANYNIYACADGKYIALGALEPKFWSKFCQAINQPEWEGRIAQMDKNSIAALKGDLAILFATKPANVWEQLGTDADVCITTIRDLADLATDEFLTQSNAISTYNYEGTTQQTIAFPVNFSGEENNLPAAPGLGEDNKLFL